MQEIWREFRTYITWALIAVGIGACVVGNRPTAEERQQAKHETCLAEAYQSLAEDYTAVAAHGGVLPKQQARQSVHMYYQVCLNT